MTTTVSVTERTKKKLEKLKEDMGASSYDELLERLAERELEVQDSLFGRVKGLSERYEREHEDRL